MLFKSKYDISGHYAIIKSEFKKYIMQNKRLETKEDTVLEEVVILGDKTIVSSSASSTISAVTNDCLPASIIPVTVTDEVQGILTTCSRISDQSRMMIDGIEIFADDI